MTNKPFVYVSSPYTLGNQATNTYFQMEIWNRLMDDGVVWPVIPLLTHFLHLYRPRPYEDWLNYDLAQLHLYDACLRLDAEHEGTGYHIHESRGADAEVEAFEFMDKPVFVTINDLYQWARGRGSD